MNNDNLTIIEKAMKQARASLEIEGLVRARLEGEISEEEFHKKILEIIKMK